MHGNIYHLHLDSRLYKFDRSRSTMSLVEVYFLLLVAISSVSVIHSVEIPCDWTQMLREICSGVSNVVGPPVCRDVLTFSSASTDVSVKVTESCIV